MDRMTYEELVAMVPAVHHSSLAFADEIKRRLPGSGYERIRPRKPGTAVSVYLEFQGQRVLSFDLKKGPGVRVYFWMPKHLSLELERALGVKTEKGTGWKGFGLSGSEDPLTERALFGIQEYWDRCTGKVLSGEATPLWKRQDRMKNLIQAAFPDEKPVFNKKCIPGSGLVPDAYLAGRKVVIEVDGAQHFREVGWFHRTQGAFASQRERDARKEAECRAAGITLLRIVEDAADLLHAESLRQAVDSATREGGVWYVLRAGDQVRMSREQ